MLLFLAFNDIYVRRNTMIKQKLLVLLLKDSFQLKWRGIHGISHWSRVRINGLLIAKDARRWMDAQIDFAKDIIGVEVLRNPSNGSKSYRYFYFEGGTGKRSFPVNHYLWPIPIEEIQKSNLEQNPGY